MTVHSTLRRTEDEIQCMERKKADIGLMPPVDFWPTVEQTKEAKDDYSKNKEALNWNTDQSQHSMQIPYTLCCLDTQYAMTS